MPVPSIGHAVQYHLDQLRAELQGQPIRVAVEAAAALLAGQVAVVTAAGLVPADRTIIDHAGKVLGLVIQGAAVGEDAEVQLTGAMSVPGIGAGEQRWLDVDGALRATPPLTGFQQEIVIGIEPDRALVQLGVPIILA